MTRGLVPDHWHLMKGDTSWYDQAACIGMPDELFFPALRGGRYKIPEVCGTCPVRSECLAFAIANRIDYGIWGGTSERERLRIAGRRKRGSVRSNQSRQVGGPKPKESQP